MRENSPAISKACLIVRTNAETTVKKAIKRAPATIPERKPRKHFQVYTVTELMRTYRDPRAILLEIAETETHILAERIGCTPFEAQQERRLCAQTVLPYVSSKMPVQVDMRMTKAIHLNIVDTTQYAQLQAIADGDSAQTIEAHIITGAVTESAIEDGDEQPEAIEATKLGNSAGR